MQNFNEIFILFHFPKKQIYEDEKIPSIPTTQNTNWLTEIFAYKLMPILFLLTPPPHSIIFSTCPNFRSYFFQNSFVFIQTYKLSKTCLILIKQRQLFKMQKCTWNDKYVPFAAPRINCTEILPWNSHTISGENDIFYIVIFLSVTTKRMTECVFNINQISFINHFEMY